MVIRAGAAFAALLVLAGCAAAPKNIQASYVSASKYEHWSCDGLKTEYWAISPRLEAQMQSQQRRRTWDTWSGAIIGITPTLLNPDNARETDIAMMKGDIQAINEQARKIGCVLDERTAQAPVSAELKPLATDPVAQ